MRGEEGKMAREGGMDNDRGSKREYRKLRVGRRKREEQDEKIREGG